LIEVIVVIVLVVMAVAIVLPLFSPSHVNLRQMWSTNQTQGRGIHQAMVSFAHSNNTYFPGLSNRGTASIPAVTASASAYGYATVANATDSPTTAMRIGVLLNGHYFPPDFLLNPVDKDVQKAALNAMLNSTHQSYAWLEVAETSAGRRAEWRDTLNHQAIVLADRNTASNTADPDTASSVWTKANSGKWQGMVVWNDGHTTWENDANIMWEDTRYNNGPVYTPADTQQQYLFNAASTDDVYVTRSGQ